MMGYIATHAILKRLAAAALLAGASVCAQQLPDALLRAVEGNDAAALERLLAGGQDANAADANGWTPLMHAALHGSEDAARCLIEHGAGVNATSARGGTALMTAAAKGHEGIVRLLLTQGVNIHAAEKNGRTALNYALDAGRRDIAALLGHAGAHDEAPHAATPAAAREARPDSALALTALDLYSPEGMDALLALLERGRLDDARQIIIRWERDNAQGSTALMAAAGAGKTALVQRLIALDAKSVNAASQSGWTALMYAALGGHLEAAQALLGAGAQPDAANADGARALMLAAHQGHADVVRLLLQAGARPDATDRSGATALHYARQNGQAGTASLLQNAASPP